MAENPNDGNISNIGNIVDTDKEYSHNFHASGNPLWHHVVSKTFTPLHYNMIPLPESQVLLVLVQTLVRSMKMTSPLSACRALTTSSYRSTSSAGEALGVKNGERRLQSRGFCRMVFRMRLHSV